MQDITKTFIDVAFDLDLLPPTGQLPPWRPSRTYKGYEAGKYGEIREINTRYVIPTDGVEDFLCMVWLINPQSTLYKVPRACVILDAYFGSPANARSIRFKDGSIFNHCADNLEWVLSTKH